MNRAEFTERILAMTDRLYRIAYGQLPDEEDRRDVIQETLQGSGRLRGK